jgi:hypothetical protein
MRWLAVIALVGCAPRASLDAPAVVVEPAIDARAGSSMERAICGEPPADLPVEILVSHGVGPCDGAPCTWPLAIVVHNPSRAPIFVVETQALDESHSARLVISYDPPIFVPPGRSIAMPRRPHVGAHSAHHIRALYLDGWGHERITEAPIERGRPLPARRWATVAAAARCEPPPPPALAPLALEASPDCAGCATEVPIFLDNPNPHRVRIVEVWVDHPNGSTTGPARVDGSIHYIEANARTRLSYRVAFEQPGRHLVRIDYQDGWGRLHELRAPVDVPAAP